MRQPDNVPGTPAVVAAVHTAPARIERPRAGIEVLGVAPVHNDVGNHIVLTSADAAKQLPVPTFVTGSENMPVRRAQKELADIVWIGCERDARPSWGANLPPGLPRR